MQRQPLDKEASLWHSNEGGKRRGAAVHGKDKGVGSGVVRLGSEGREEEEEVIDDEW